ncbi:hypothetical protein FRC09_001810, partial [Ceratobasidium sp. 395]
MSSVPSTPATLVPSSQVLPPETGSIGTPLPLVPSWGVALVRGEGGQPALSEEEPIMVYISLRRLIYHIHVHVLRNASRALDTLFRDAYGSVGSTYDNPMVLEEYDPPEWWDAFLSYIYVP